MRASLTRLHWRPRVGQRFQARRLAPEPEQADPRDSLGPPQEAPLLKRPVLLVHGFNSGPGAWEGLRTWLTRGGLNKDGGVVQAETAEIDPEGRVFSMQFSRACNPVSVNAQELRQAIDHITSATGSPEVDIVAHSKGGLDTRWYLDQGDEKVDKFVMMATPNHGSQLANLSLALRQRGMAIAPGSPDPHIRQALIDCRQTSGSSNPWLDQLNNNWNRQRQRADILLISGQGRPTLTGRLKLTLKGDGVVSEQSVLMPDVPSRCIRSADHSSVKNHPQALQATAAFLVG